MPGAALKLRYQKNVFCRIKVALHLICAGGDDEIQFWLGLYSKQFNEWQGYPEIWPGEFQIFDVV